MSSLAFARPSVLRALRPARVPISTQSALARLLSTLAVLEHRGGKVSSGSLPAITAAAKLGGPVTAFVAGSDAASVAEQAAKIKGVEKVVHVANGAYDKVRTQKSV